MEGAAGAVLESKVAGLDIIETIHILLQVERELEAKLRDINQMGRFRDKAQLVTEKMKETEDNLVARLDATLDKLNVDIPKQAERAFAAADLVVGELAAGVNDLEEGLKLLSNSSGDPSKQQSNT